jgi:hypothetical protein
MDRQIGNPGLRVVVAAGPLLQVSDPESWKKLPCKLETANWFVLTGPPMRYENAWKPNRSVKGNIATGIGSADRGFNSRAPLNLRGPAWETIPSALSRPENPRCGVLIPIE